MMIDSDKLDSAEIRACLINNLWYWYDWVWGWGL